MNEGLHVLSYSNRIREAWKMKVVCCGTRTKMVGSGAKALDQLLSDSAFPLVTREMELGREKNQKGLKAGIFVVLGS